MGEDGQAAGLRTSALLGADTMHPTHRPVEAVLGVYWLTCMLRAKVVHSVVACACKRRIQVYILVGLDTKPFQVYTSNVVALPWQRARHRQGQYACPGYTGVSLQQTLSRPDHLSTYIAAHNHSGL